MPRRAAFLDRDGVLNVRPPEHEYVTDLAALRLVSGAAEAVRLLRRYGYVPVVVSNQRGVSRGLVSDEVLRAIEGEIRDAAIDVERFYYCPHDLDDKCLCRKPEPGLLLDAARDLDLELGESVMIGDSESDIVAGRRAGCQTILLGQADTTTEADARASDLLEAAHLVVRKRLDSTRHR